MYFPNMREETSPSKTGYFKSACSGELSFGFTQRLAPGITGVLSLSARNESAKFDGTGTRGTSNGTEQEWLFALPLQLRF